MMNVKLGIRYTAPGGHTCHPGSVIELPENAARTLIDGGLAEHIRSKGVSPSVADGDAVLTEKVTKTRSSRRGRSK